MLELELEGPGCRATAARSEPSHTVTVQTVSLIRKFPLKQACCSGSIGGNCYWPKGPCETTVPRVRRPPQLSSESEYHSGPAPGPSTPVDSEEVAGLDSQLYN